MCSVLCSIVLRYLSARLLYLKFARVALHDMRSVAHDYCELQGGASSRGIAPPPGGRVCPRYDHLHCGHTDGYRRSYVPAPAQLSSQNRQPDLCCGGGGTAALSNRDGSSAAQHGELEADGRGRGACACPRTFGCGCWWWQRRRCPPVMPSGRVHWRHCTVVASALMDLIQSTHCHISLDGHQCASSTPSALPTPVRGSVAQRATCLPPVCVLCVAGTAISALCWTSGVCQVCGLGGAANSGKGALH